MSGVLVGPTPTVNTSGVNLAGFIYFVRNGMGIPATVLTDDSIFLPMSYNYAAAMVINTAALFNIDIYALMVNNLAADFLVNIAVDTPPSTYFIDLRKHLGLGSFLPGVVNSAGDNGTSVSLNIPDFYKELTYNDLSLLRTPWGRVYFNLAQQLSSAWGLS